MLVKTKIEHANDHGDKRCKAVGDVYSHPSPATLIATGYVEAASAAKRRRKPVVEQADD